MDKARMERAGPPHSRCANVALRWELRHEPGPHHGVRGLERSDAILVVVVVVLLLGVEELLLLLVLDQ